MLTAASEKLVNALKHKTDKTAISFLDQYFTSSLGQKMEVAF